MDESADHPEAWPQMPPPGAGECRAAAVEAAKQYMYQHYYAGWNDDNWRGGYNDIFSRIAEYFPTLRDAPGVRPWNPRKLDMWAAHIDKSGPNPCPGSGAVMSAAFVLSIFRHDTPWLCGPFSMLSAVTRWDYAHRKAFTRWLFRENDGFDPGRISNMELLDIMTAAVSKEAEKKRKADEGEDEEC